MNAKADILLLETALEMERAARFSAERRLLEKQKELEEWQKQRKEPANNISTFIQPALLDAITKHLQTGILIENESGLLVSVNSTFCELFNIPDSPTNMVGTDILQKGLFIPSLFLNYSYFIQRTNEILNNREEIRNDIIELRSGITVERDYIPIIQEGIYKGHIWYYQNTTEKNNWERKLQTQKRLYESILSKMPADIAVFNPEHADLFLNPIAIKDAELRKWVIEWMIGKQEGQTSSTNWEEAGSYKKLFNQVIQAKENGSIEETKINENGIEEHFIRHLYPIVDDNNEITMLIGYTTNITERVKAEQAIVKAKKVTEEVAKAKEVFLANMSHEIRTPMNGISGLITLLQKTKLNQQQQKLVSLMHDTSHELIVVVNDILNIEKIAAGKLELEKTVFNPIAQLNHTIAALKHKAAEKKIYIKITKGNAETLSVLGDPHRLHQILNNLISNAIKFTMEGGITIQWKTAFEKNKLLFTIRIKDTGIGIPKEKLNSIFLPFVQANQTTTREFGGTGLGLSICKNLVDLHKGSITVSSIPGKGSTFEVTLPYEQSVESVVINTPSFVNNNSLRGKKILIAEDVPLNRFIAEEFLQAHGAITETVDTGLLAVARVKDSNFDIVLMDIAMPGMDGITATKTIRQLSNARKATIPIIALTANIQESDTASYIHAGMQACIAKPFTEEVLIKTIEDTCTIQNETLYDAAVLQKTGRGKTAFVEKMVSLFLDTAPLDIALLNEAIHQKNWPLVHQTAHRMKSSFEGMGIQSLKSTIRMVENLAKTNPDENQLITLSSTITQTAEKVMHDLATNFPKSNSIPIA